jgi:tryptophan synthase beta subunit
VTEGIIPALKSADGLAHEMKVAKDKTIEKK